MAFWSGERLEFELPKLVNPFDPTSIDCASYQLRVGTQAFVTSDRFANGRPKGRLIDILGSPPDDTVRILPGQFAFLLTHETVEVPPSAMALISIRARYKFMGLINVSGFHVDPGWKGRLLFSLYNAGPREVLVKRHDPLFVIVYADLDRQTAKVYRGDSQHQESIKPELVHPMLSQVFSPLMLQRKMDELASSVTFLRTVGWVMISVVTVSIALTQLMPNAVGAVLAAALQAAGYEIKQADKGK
jgi:dCTP deaminase